jgi:hypothetical protein
MWNDLTLNIDWQIPKKISILPTKIRITHSWKIPIIYSILQKISMHDILVTGTNGQ